MEKQIDGMSGDIVFSLQDQTECLRFACDGRCFVRGELVDTNQEIYAAFCAWLRETGKLSYRGRDEWRY